MYRLNKNIVVAYKLFSLKYLLYSNTKMSFPTFPISIHFSFLNFNNLLKKL